MGARRPQAQRQSPVSHESLIRREDTGASVCFKRIPETSIQALMEAPPGVEPEQSSEDLVDDEGGPALAALAALPEKQREAFALHKLAGLPFTEVAKRLGVSKTTCFRLVQEAQQMLLDALENP